MTTENSSSSSWLGAVAVVMALSAFVKVEPAPYDFGITGLAFAFAWSQGLRKFAGGEFIAWCLAIFLTLHIPGFVIAEELDRALFYALITAYLAVSALLLAAFVDRMGADALLYAGVGYCIAILSTFLAYTIDLLGIISFRELIYYDALRVEGFFKDPNVLGPAAIPALMLAAPVSRHLASKGVPHGLRLLFLFPTVGASSALIYLSYSRGAWLTALIAVIVSAGMTVLLRPSVGRLSAVAFALIASLMFAAFPSLAGAVVGAISSDEFLLERLGGGGLQRYDDDRLAMQAALIEKVSENLLGYGPGQTELFASQFHATILGSSAAHSSYLRVLFENGVPGLIVYVAILAATLLSGFRASYNNAIVGIYARPLFGCFVGLLISGLAVDTLHWRHFWIVAALVWGAYALARRQSGRARD